MFQPLLLSVAFGVGAFLLYDGLTRPPTEPGPPRRSRLDDWLAQAGLGDVTPRDFLAFSLGSALLCGLLSQMLLGWPLVSATAALAALALPAVYYDRRRERRRAALEGALVEAIAQLRDAIRAGLGLEEALAGLALHGPEVLRPEIAALVRRSRIEGFQPALAAARDRLALPLFDTVAISLSLNDRVGGRQVSRVLDRLAHATREQVRTAEELRAHQSRNVLAARVVAAVPLLVLLAIRRLNPGYLALFSTAPGQLLLAGCVASIAVGYLAMLRVARLPEEGRVLR